MLGVVQVGEPISERVNALHILLLLLLSVGALSLFGASAGGLLLADRALAPVRWAFKRQQDFIADASHELRTPLALLRADAEVLLRGRERLNLTEEDATLLEDIIAESAHMGALATNMLTLARLDAGQLHLEHDVINLGDLADGVVQRSRALAEQADITLSVEHTNSSVVLGDKTMLEQVALILLDNAIKYNRAHGSITVRTFTQDGKAHLEISDTGIGIAPEHLPHLGERFYRVDTSRSRESGGSGLGLAIARGIATAHNGTLTLTSNPDQGTTATLALHAIALAS